MHAITTPSYGGPEVLTWAEVADPIAGAGEVLVEVAASAVNRADLLQRQGFYPPPPGASEVIGMECSGTVAGVGAGVSGWPAGMEVCALLAGGGYAERVVVPAGQVLPVPRGVDLITAAALPEVTCTVWANVFMLGTMAIQLAHRHGATVLCTAGSAAKLSRCRELGADVAINYRDEDFVVRAREATGGRGVDVILDNMGGAYLPRNVDTLAVGGRLMTIGLQGGRTGELDLGVLLAKRAAVHATSLRARPVEEKAAIVAAVREHVWPAIESGEVRVIVDRVVPLPDAAEAHRVMEASEHVGKVVLER